ncbi:hypothetical protein BaRGS_00014791 [Batillaria attramentaria]|uniref:Uncharacterized protein n=1 Tax=Batillaria attramentaria TaxID=370345 RepID=A0ABD0L3C5_9CAEN
MSDLQVTFGDYCQGQRHEEGIVHAHAAVLVHSLVVCLEKRPLVSTVVTLNREFCASHALGSCTLIPANQLERFCCVKNFTISAMLEGTIKADCSLWHHQCLLALQQWRIRPLH